jgi:hypothetical protein
LRKIKCYFTIIFYGMIIYCLGLTFDLRLGNML